MRRMLAWTLLAAAAVGVATRADTPNTLTAQEKADGWVLLFDGSTTAGWHGYNQTTMSEGWAVKDGALTRVGKATDISSDKEYAATISSSTGRSPKAATAASCITSSSRRATSRAI